MSTPTLRTADLSAVLSTLTPVRLQEIAERLGLPNTGSPEKLRRRLAKSSLTAERLLGLLGHHELVEVCRQAGVPHSGDAAKLRQRLLSAGRSRSGASTAAPPPARSSRSAGRYALPEELQRDLREKQNRYRMRRGASLLKRFLGTIVSGAVGGAVVFGLTNFLSTDPPTIERMTIGAAVVCMLLKLTGRGRFSGAFIFGGGFLLATYLGWDGNEYILLDLATPSRMAISWTVALVAGVILGMAEEMSQEYSD